MHIHCIICTCLFVWYTYVSIYIYIVKVLDLFWSTGSIGAQICRWYSNTLCCMLQFYTLHSGSFKLVLKGCWSCCRHWCCCGCYCCSSSCFVCRRGMVSLVLWLWDLCKRCKSQAAKICKNIPWLGCRTWFLFIIQIWMLQTVFSVTQRPPG